MFRRLRRGSIVSTAVVLGLLWSVAATSAAPRTSVIVVLDDAVSNPAAIARQLGGAQGFRARHVYGTALKGFSASVPLAAVAALSRNPQVVSVEAETVEQIVAQTTPTGVDRIEVDRRVTLGGVTVNQPIAIIDTGISAHSDLNLAGGYSAPGGSYSDGNGHGTHVAGTVAARDNGAGVVGVAPGAPVWAVRVCGNSGSCTSGDIVRGIDWVAARKADFKAGLSGGINFAAANFSISSADSNRSCSNPANTTHRAICGLVGQGVVFVMAAGNDARSKTAYPVAFTVAAIADFNGKAGGGAASTCRSDEDDTLANFSNWGVDIAAPGTCILSTWNNGGYSTISGTSMATPHVTGAVGLYLHATGQAAATNSSGVTAIENAIVAGALAQSHACGYTNERGSSEKLLFVNSTQFGGDGTCETTAAPPPPPPSNTAPSVSITAPANNATFTTAATISFSGSATDTESGNLTSSLVWTSNVQGQVGTGGSFSRTLNAGTHTITASATDPGGLTGSASVTITVNTAGGGDTSSMSATLSGSSQSSGSSWTATATITIRDGSGTLLSGAAITGSWSGGGGGTSCTTGSTGTCSLSKSQPKRVGSATFTVTNVTKSGYVYDDADPSITIPKS